MANGVPPLLNGSIAGPVVLLAADAASVLSALFGAPRWGIFFQGSRVDEADSIVAFEFRQDWSVADYPMEQGAFQSYDKVIQPYSTRVRAARGGSPADRQAFETNLLNLANSLALFDVVTPEQVFLSANVDHVDFRRSATDGAGMIVADVWLRQINVSGVGAFSNTASPASADPVNAGTVQPVAPTAPQQSALSSLFN